jgi:hypothetical protein
VKTIIFVHGTGVREPAYSTTFGLVQQALTKRLGATGVRVEPCYWGGTLGAKLFLEGASIPTFDTTKAIPGEEHTVIDDTEYLLSLWAMLYENPFAELDLLALRNAAPGEESPPGQKPPGHILDAQVKRLTTDGGTLERDAGSTLRTLLTEAGLVPYFNQARDDLVAHPSYRLAIARAVEPLTDYRLAVARALVAHCVQLLRENQDAPEGFLPMDGVTRDQIIELLVAALGGREMGVGDWIKERAGLLVKGIATRRLQRKRGQISSAMTPFAADIVMYQTRPQTMRAFVRETVQKAVAAAKEHGENGEVILIGHSLGGIIAVDMLIEQSLPAVRHLITVGSQAPLLYELNALSSLPFDRTVAQPPHPLPGHFPASWLNIYDVRDFLSYLAAPVFGEQRVTDVQVDNRQPFPEAHSAYWTNAQVWNVILECIGS